MGGIVLTKADYQNEAITEKDRQRAKQCLDCPVCRHARKKQRGLAFWFVKKIDTGICPAGKAYEKVYQRKAYEPIPDTDNTDSPE